MSTVVIAATVSKCVPPQDRTSSANSHPVRALAAVSVVGRHLLSLRSHSSFLQTRLIFGETAGQEAAVVCAHLRTGRRHSGAGEHRPPRGSLKGLCPVPAARLEGPSLAPDAEGGSAAICRGWRPAGQMAIEVDGSPPGPWVRRDVLASSLSLHDVVPAGKGDPIVWTPRPLLRGSLPWQPPGCVLQSPRLSVHSATCWTGLRPDPACLQGHPLLAHCDISGSAHGWAMPPPLSSCAANQADAARHPPDMQPRVRQKTCRKACMTRDPLPSALLPGLDTDRSKNGTGDLAPSARAFFGVIVIGLGLGAMAPKCTPDTELPSSEHHHRPLGCS